MPKMGGKSGVSSVPESWSVAASIKKEPIDWPTWPDVPHLRSGPELRTTRDDVHTARTEKVQVLFTLGIAGGIGLEAVRLRIVAWAFDRERDVTATLEVAGGRLFVTIARIDAWPSDPHANVRARGNRRFIHLPPIIDGHHVHRFSDNAKLGLDAFTPPSNLPLAAPIVERLQSFRDFLGIVAVEFEIDGIGEFGAPEGWKGLL